MQKIALTGVAGSGKTTLAGALEKEGWTLANYTDVLKTLAVEALASIGYYTTVAEIKDEKGRYRDFLQALGDLLGFNYGGVNGEYIKLALQDWIIDGCETPVVFDNVRTDEQWEVLQAMGFSLVRLSVPSDVALERLGANGVGEWMERPIEKGVRSAANLTLDGRHPVEYLVSQITDRKLLV